MGVLIFTALLTFALLAIMLSHQAQAIERGHAELYRPELLVLIQQKLRDEWRQFITWSSATRKSGSRHSAFLLAKVSHWIGDQLRKLIVRLHRHGRSE